MKVGCSLVPSCNWTVENGRQNSKLQQVDDEAIATIVGHPRDAQCCNRCKYHLSQEIFHSGYRPLAKIARPSRVRRSVSSA